MYQIKNSIALIKIRKISSVNLQKTYLNTILVLFNKIFISEISLHS